MNPSDEGIAEVVRPKVRHDEDIVIEQNREVIAEEATRHGEEVGILGLLREPNTVSIEACVAHRLAAQSDMMSSLDQCSLLVSGGCYEPRREV